uniref:Vitellogenin domain-containing protein n=1 Tax=Clastoptera arizonana TaxID=38151 RepID=A0A1B6BYM2_9HEMI
MRSQWWWQALFIGLCFLAIIHADKKCGGECKGKAKDLVYNFEDGTVYTYEVEGLSLTQLPGSPNDVSKISITATAEISAQPKCTYVLQLSNVHVSGADGKKHDGLSADCAKPIKFSFNNGQLSPELCTEDDDNGAALNIKRAVISLFQTSDEVGSNSRSDISYETDIFGSCPTNYAITKNGGKVNVVKSRNLNRCAHRESFDLPVLSTPYYSQKTDFQSSPLIAAKLTVNQDIEDGILKKASSEEEYEYRPALSAEYAAKIINKVSITSVGSKKGSISANGNEQQSIIFESPHPSHGVGNAGSIVKALKTVVNNVDPAVDHSAADDFLELVDELAHGTKADILTVYSQIKSGAGFKDKEVAKGLLLDGLLYTGSSESVEAAAELLHSKEFSESGSIKWYLDLNFVKHVSKASIKAVTPLLDGKPPHQAYLGIGALAGKYCRQHDCEGVQEFQQLLKKLATPILDGCKVKSVEEENNVIASLKGLANVQLITDEVAAKLVQCAEDGTVKTRVRSAALSAFTSNKLLKSSAIKIFKDIEEDAELRIKAYLALVASPCGKVADVIKETIDKEPINQVGSFIVSHLRNLRATTNPDKEAAKYFLGEIIPNKRFPFDIRKFSQNRELSYSLDTLNIGAVGEANTIYSQKSYLPRYVNLNLTSNIFGHSFNFLEIGARAENLEYLFEKYFGPKGAYNKHPNEVIEDTAEATENFYHRYQKNYRNRRSITQKQINDVAKKVKFGVDNEDRTVDLDLSVKLFGAEIGWFKLNGDTTTSLEQFYNKVTGRVGESVDKLKNFDLDYQKARVFLDATVTYPTALGLALKFKVLGGSAAKIKIDSKLDVKEIIRAIKESNTHLNTDIKFQLIPSASIELNSLITMDADVLQTGVKVSANLHSSTGTDISLHILDGSGIDLKVGIPVKNQELVSFKSSIVSVVREKGQPESNSPVNFNTKRSEYGGCFDQLTPFIGLTFCGEISAPMEGFRALSPAYGPSKLVLRIEKEDDSLTSYHFKAHYDNKDPNAVEFLVVLDTPNSKSDRKLGLIIGAKSKPRQEISLKAISPWKKITAEAFVIDTDTEQSINAKLNDDNEEYTLKIGAKLSGNENHKKYEPLLEYKEPQGGGKQWSLIGRKGGAKGGKTQQSLGVTGAVIVDKTPNGKKYDLKSVTITTSAVKVTLDGDINVESNYVGSDLNIALDKTAIKLASKFKWDEKTCSAHVNFVPEQQKEMGFDFKLNLEEDKQKFSNKLVFIHGPDLNSEEARFTLENYLQYNFESAKSFDFETKNSLTYPLLGLLAKIEIEASPKELELELEGGFNKFTIKGDLKAKTATKHVGDYSIDFSGNVLDNGIQLTAKHDVISDTKSKFTNSLELTPGGKYQLNAIILHDFKGKNINHAIDAELKIPYDPKLVKLNTKLVNNKAESTVVFILVGGNKPIVEIKGTVAKTNKPEGNFKVYLPKYIDSKGSFKFDGQNGAGSFSADLPKTTRQIAGKGEISLTSTNYKGFGEVQWDVKNNPAKKVRIETDTDYSKNSVDSKNSLQVSDCKATLNMKGNLDGKITDGTLKGEAELVLNNGRKVNVKLDRELHIRPDGTDIDAAYEIAHFETQGAQPQKVALKLKGKNIDIKKAIFDGQVDLSYTSKNQDNVVVHVVGKKVPQGDKWAISGEGSVSGSIVKKIDVKLDSELSNAFLKGEYVNNGELPPASYHLTANDANSGVSVSVNGKMNGHQSNNEFDLKLPADLPINTVKWTSNNFLNYRPSDGQNIKVKYDNKVTWNGDKFVKVNVEASREPKGVSGKVEWESHLKSQRSLSGKVTQDVVNDIVNTDIEGLFTYEGKSADLLVKVNCKQDGSVVNVDAVANLPEKGKYSANLKHKETKVSDSERTRDSVLVLNGDGKTVTITSFLEVKKPDLLVVKFLVEAPQGKSGIYVKSVKKGNRHYDIEQKFNWISKGGGNLDLDIEFDLEDIKDFIIKVAADSPKLEINKFQFDVGSKAAVKTGGQRVTFSAKTADKDIFSGHANYQVKDNLPTSLIINGKGVLNVGKETYPLTVKCDYDEKDHSVSLDIDAKPFTFNSIIEKKFPSMKSSHKFCKESVCSLVEFKQTVQLDENFESASIEREITIDLESLLANNHKFNYKQLLKKDGLTLDHKINLDYGKYSSEYHSYIKPSEAGIAFTLPNRIIAFELSYDDFLKTKGFPALVEATFYPNKKKIQVKNHACLLRQTELNLLAMEVLVHFHQNCDSLHLV